MFTSDIEKNKKGMLKTVLVYLGFTLFTAFFGAVYEAFSHSVYSYYMIYAFALPLVCGVTPFTLMLFKDFKTPSRLSFNLYNSGIAALTVGCIIKGMLDIYGTGNPLMYVYFIAGALFVLSGIAAYIKSR